MCRNLQKCSRCLHNLFLSVCDAPAFCPNIFRKNLTTVSALSQCKHSQTYHKRAKADPRYDWGLSVIANHCYWCDRLFASKEVARARVRQSQKLGACPRGRARRPYDLQVPTRLCCPVCKHQFSDYDLATVHVLEHFVCSSSSSFKPSRRQMNRCRNFTRGS